MSDFLINVSLFFKPASLQSDRWRGTAVFVPKPWNISTILSRVEGWTIFFLWASYVWKLGSNHGGSMNILKNSAPGILFIFIISTLSVSCVVVPKHHPRSVVVKSTPVKVIKRHHPRHAPKIIVSPRHRSPVYRKPVKSVRKPYIKRRHYKKNRHHSKGWARLN